MTILKGLGTLLLVLACIAVVVLLVAGGLWAFVALAHWNGYIAVALFIVVVIILGMLG